MRILFVSGIYPPDAGGPATYTRAMARALASQGHEVFVVAYGDREGVETEDGFSVTRVSRLQPTWKRYLSFMRAVQSRAKDVDLVYLQGPVSEGFPGTIGAILAGKPTVMKIVGDYAWEIYMQEPGDEDKVLLDEFVQVGVGARRRRARRSLKIRMIEMIERWTAKHAKKIITPSEYLKGIVEKWGIAPEKIHVVYNACSWKLPSGTEPSVPHRELSDEERMKLRSELGFPTEAGSMVMLTAVRFVPWKACDFIIELLRDLPAWVHFAIAGSGPCEEEWKEHARQSGNEERVHFLGKLPEERMRDCYSAADLFILPSGYEGFPNVIPEAVSNGLPCFVSDRGGNPETKTVIGSDRITVLPYRDREAWLTAFGNPWPERKHGFISGKLFFSNMVNTTVSVLKEAVPNL